MLVYELITPNTVGLSPEQFLNSIAYKIWWYILTADTRRRWPPAMPFFSRGLRYSLTEEEKGN